MPRELGFAKLRNIHRASRRRTTCHLAIIMILRCQGFLGFNVSVNCQSLLASRGHPCGAQECILGIDLESSRPLYILGQDQTHILKCQTPHTCVIVYCAKAILYSDIYNECAPHTHTLVYVFFLYNTQQHATHKGAHTHTRVGEKVHILIIKALFYFRYLH